VRGELAVALGLAYLVIGAGVAMGLSRRGHPPGMAVSAVAVWPLLAPLLQAAPGPTGSGPMAERIRACFVALAASAAEAGGAGLPRAEMAGLMTSLYRADERLAMVDRLLENDGLSQLEAAGAGGDRGAELRRSLETLRTARSHAAGEIEAVLAGVLQLRVQLGIQALAGDRQPVRERLQEMTARVHALEEVTSFTL